MRNLKVEIHTGYILRTLGVEYQDSAAQPSYVEQDLPNPGSFEARCQQAELLNTEVVVANFDTLILDIRSLVRISVANASNTPRFQFL